MKTKVKVRPKEEKYDVGVLVGRFQVAELTDAHKAIIENIKEKHNQHIIIVGVSPTLGTKRNPLGYTARMKMIQQVFPEAVVTYLMDCNSDDIWSKELDKLIRAICPLGSVCLYGGRSSFLDSYNGYFPTLELDFIPHSEGTKVREEIGKNMYDSADFRRGIIHSCQNQYPKVFPTIDIAVIKRETKIPRVLLGKRKGKDTFRFPGGFIDPSDASAERAAIREVREEFDIEIDNDSVEYVCSNRQSDWRYKKMPDEVITTFLYKVEFMFGNCKALEEFVETLWFPVSEESLKMVEESHKTLFKNLINNLKRKGKKK